jgi:hypothetical protein
MERYSADEAAHHQMTREFFDSDMDAKPQLRDSDGDGSGREAQEASPDVPSSGDERRRERQKARLMRTRAVKVKEEPELQEHEDEQRAAVAPHTNPRRRIRGRVSDGHEEAPSEPQVVISAREASEARSVRDLQKDVPDTQLHEESQSIDEKGPIAAEVTAKPEKQKRKKKEKARKRSQGSEPEHEQEPQVVISARETSEARGSHDLQERRDAPDTQLQEDEEVTVKPKKLKKERAEQEPEHGQVQVPTSPHSRLQSPSEQHRTVVDNADETAIPDTQLNEDEEEAVAAEVVVKTKKQRRKEKAEKQRQEPEHGQEQAPTSSHSAQHPFEEHQTADIPENADAAASMPAKKSRKRKRNTDVSDVDGAVAEPPPTADSGLDLQAQGQVDEPSLNAKNTRKKRKRAEDLGRSDVDEQLHGSTPPAEGTDGQQDLDNEEALSVEDNFWPAGDDEEVEQLLAQRNLRSEDLEEEMLEQQPRTAHDRHANEVKKARNVLRRHFQTLRREQCLYKGDLREERNEAGELVEEWAPAGEHFPVPKPTKDEKRAAKQRKKGLAELRRALRESLVKSEVQSRRMAAAEDAMEIDEPDMPEENQASEQAEENHSVGDADPEEISRPVEKSRPKKKKLKLKIETQASQLNMAKMEPASASAADGNANDVQARPIPTPPESEEIAYDPVNPAGHDATGQVTEWLAKQEVESPMLPDEVSEQPAEPSQKRKRVSSHAGDRDGLQLHAYPTSGPFTAEEKALADRTFARVMEDENLSEAELIAQIQNWRTCGVFKEEIKAAFHHRPPDGLRKFCKTRYHGMVRGSWTAEQDDDLRNAYSRHPRQWTKISETVGRPAGDCKDRWEKHLRFSNKATGPWTVDEERALLEIVEECIDTIKKQYRNDEVLLNDRERLESLVSWRLVAEKLGTRNTVRCREKYQKLKRRATKVGSLEPDFTVESDAGSFLVAQRHVRDFEIGDFYDAFVEIHTSFPDRNQRFHYENSVIWSVVSVKHPHSRFAGHLPLRRAALAKALEEWPANNPKIRKRLERAGTIPAKAYVLAEWLESAYAGRLEFMKRTFRADLLAMSPEELAEMRESQKKKSQKRSRKSQDRGLSTAAVGNSDDEEEVNGMSESGDVYAEPEDSEAEGVADEDQDSEHEGGEDEKDTPAKIEDTAHGDEESEGEESVSAPEVPRTQVHPSHSPARSDDGAPLNLARTPKMGPRDFLNRLKSSDPSGSSRRKTIGYGKKERRKAERRKTIGH